MLKEKGCCLGAVQHQSVVMTAQPSLEISPRHKAAAAVEASLAAKREKAKEDVFDGDHSTKNTSMVMSEASSVTASHFAHIRPVRLREKAEVSSGAQTYK